MTLFIAGVLLIGGLGILVLGANWLVKGASAIAAGFGVSALIIGLTVVAFGTSTPELTVNVYAALTGATDVAIGNILGSNIANILLILGISAIITPLAIQTSTVRWELPFALLAMVMLFVLGSDALIDGSTTSVIGRIDGIVLIGFFALFMAYIFAMARSTSTPAAVEQEHDSEKNMLPTVQAIALVVLGLAALVLGGKLLVDNAIVIARAIGLSEAVIGLTVVAVGTSLPELATSVVAALRKEIDIAVGNIVGSNIFNVFWILGLTAVLAPLPTPPSFLIDAVVGIAATVVLVLAVFIGRKGYIERWQGVAFVVAYLSFVTYLVTAA